MAKDELSIPGTLVKKSNSIIRTRITVKSVEASRILAHLVACIRTDDEKLKETYSVPAKDIIPYIGGENYKRIKATCKELASSFAETEEPDPDGPHPIFTAQPFFTRIRYRKGVISATFNPFMRPHLLKLKDCFTTYNLMEYLSLPSLYSQRIFELFSRLHNKDEIAGTGIGLAICKKIVENHKGYILAKGKPGEGAVFEIYLPEDIA